jgi:hypothetical protein
MADAVIAIPQAVAVTRKRLPSTSMPCMMRASLRASATLALFGPARLASLIAQLLGALQLMNGLVRMGLAAS